MVGLNFCLSQQALRGWGFERGYTVKKKNLNEKHNYMPTHTHILRKHRKQTHTEILSTPRLGALVHNSFAGLQSLFPCVANLWTQFPAVHSAVTPVGEDR